MNVALKTAPSLELSTPFQLLVRFSRAPWIGVNKKVDNLPIWLLVAVVPTPMPSTVCNLATLSLRLTVLDVLVISELTVFLMISWHGNIVPLLKTSVWCRVPHTSSAERLLSRSCVFSSTPWESPVIKVWESSATAASFSNFRIEDCLETLPPGIIQFEGSDRRLLSLAIEWNSSCWSLPLSEAS